jgi:hypothetical protein
MMKEIYCYQEIATDIAQGEQVTFRLPLTVSVTARRQSEASETITATLELGLGGEVIACSSEFATIDRLLYAFDIADHEEIFEVLGEQ